NSSSSYYELLMEAIAERYGVDLEAPWQELSQEHRDVFLNGTDGEPVRVTYRNRYGRRRSYATRFEGIVANLQRRYRETDSEFTRERIEEDIARRPWPVTGGGVWEYLLVAPSPRLRGGTPARGVARGARRRLADR